MIQNSERHEACVYLVGAGPGDPDLLTVKAARLLRTADIVVFDRLIAPPILEFVPSAVPRVYAGKATGEHAMPQEEINALLVRLARKHRIVVRLKGGDPFVFGRGCEEALHLAANNIPFEVVPGVTAASGCTASARIPLTHRGLATSVTFVTGHCRADANLELNWHCLANPDTTLVFYMGMANLPQISRELMRAGLPASTPAAAISNGTTPNEQILIATLADLPRRTVEARLRAPVLIVIGRVVALAETLGHHRSFGPLLEAVGA